MNSDTLLLLTSHLRKTINWLCLVLLSSPFIVPSATMAAPLFLESSVQLDMYRLDVNGASLGVLCVPSVDTARGCTAFPGNNNYAYPYDSSSPTVSIETDYLLDVIAKEMNPDPYSEPAALYAQALASRSFVQYYINNPPELGDPPDEPFNNSNKYQVFIPYQFEYSTPSAQQQIREAMVSGAYLAAAEDNPDKLAAKAVFAADIIPFV